MFLGIDLGTSSVKLVLTDRDGHVLRTARRDYPLSFPKPGWSEQDPHAWWDAVVQALDEILEGLGPGSVKGVGCAGQMHGLVALDSAGNVIRPAILWNDGRTYRETEYLNETIGCRTLSQCTGNIAFAGFTAPKILWMRNNEPENYHRLSMVLLPKDYINFRLTGNCTTDYSDASGMLLLDVKNRRWSARMLEICGLTEDRMPRLLESYEVAGTVREGLHSALTGAVVVAGAGDNAGAAVATGTVGDGSCNISLGTSGTLFVSSARFGVDPANALHSFAHADGKYHLMGCMLSAASCNSWFYEGILETKDYNAQFSRITEDMLGHNHVFFLPYLMGERSPINDTDARGTFTGLRMDTTRADMNLAVLEGVAFALRQSLDVARSLGNDIRKTRLCGGGARSGIWRTILANVMDVEIEILENEEGPGYGGAMLAMVACGEYPGVEECASALVKVKQTIRPESGLRELYEKQYRRWCMIYPAMKDVFRALAD